VSFVLAHSRAGYRLLRAKSFALNNYCTYLQRLSPADPQIPELFWQAIQPDPSSPMGYHTAVDFFLSRSALPKALEYARPLLKICSPPIAQRTMFCLRQNPATAAMVDRGELTPQLYAQQILERCERALGQK
jgi:hypothetical protein